jgi:hypothetical protein
MKKLAFVLLLTGCASTGGGRYAPPPQCDSTDVVVSAALPQPTDLQDLVRRRQDAERRARCKAQES